MAIDSRMAVLDPALRTLTEHDLKLYDRSSLSPLIRAVLLGVPAGELKKYKAHVDGTDDQGRSALRLAVELGSLDMVKELIDNLGANVDAPDKEGVTPLHTACARGDGELVDLLLCKVKQPCPVDLIRSETPLIAACKNMNWMIVERLMKMDVSAADSAGRTALHWVMLRAASIADCMDAVNCLLANQANVNAQDKQGRAPLHIAAERGLADACALLVKRGAKLNIPDSNGETPLHRCVVRPNTLQGKTSALQTLLDLKADPLIRRLDGKTIEDLLTSAFEQRTWNDAQRIVLEVAIKRVRKAADAHPK
jgi:ankyrin repeat protein